MSYVVGVRRIVRSVEDVFHEGGPPLATPLRRGTVAAVVSNPFAGKYVEDISSFMDDLKPLGLDLAQQLISAMDVQASEVQSYGKGAIVGAEGELEHGALWHAPGGHAMREVLGGAAPDSRGGGKNAIAIVPSTKKVGGLGASLDVPLTHINAIYVRSHFDSIEVRIPDAPRPREIVVVLAMSTGPRIHARIGGLSAAGIADWDGQR